MLSTFVLEPIRWVDRYGWRPLEPIERAATLHLWRRIGEQMGVRDIPTRLADLDAYNRRYEAERFAPSPAGRRLADAAVTLVAGWFPAPLRPMVPELMCALLDPPARAAFGWPDPSPLAQGGTDRTLRLASRIKAALPTRRQPQVITARRHRSYPHGYTIEGLGPASSEN